MDPPGWRQAENGHPAKQAIYPLPVCFNFHDLNHYSQTNRLNNKSVMDYFKDIGVIVGYFKGLHQIMGTAPKLDQEKVWALSKIGATYDAKVQSWILSYAINYIMDHFLTSFKQKEMNPRFHEWVYVIRSFQGCDANFEADSFINTVLKQYLDILNHINAREKLKDDDLYDDSNPKKTIMNLQRTKADSFKGLKKRFIEDRNYFWFLCLCRSNQEIYLGYENCYKLQCPGDEELLKFPIDLLLMRRTKGLLKEMINGLLIEKRGTPLWILRTKIFLESYDGWKFTIPFEDEDMKRGIEELNKSTRTRYISPCEPGRKAENHKRNRSASLP